MNRVSHFLLAAAATTAGTPAAAVDGFIIGSLVVEDQRADWVDGSLHNGARPDTTGVRGVLIEVAPLATVQDDDDLVTVGPRFYARTDRFGAFSVHWSDDRFDDLPRPLAVSVIWESPDMDDSTLLPIETQITERPGYRFAVRPEFGRNTLLVDRFVVTGGALTLLIPPVELPASDTSAAYLTGEEYYRRVIDGENGAPSFLVSGRMKDVVIFINSPLFGLAPDDTSVHVGSERPQGDPYVIAHEISHVANWNAYGFTSALQALNPLQYCRYAPPICLGDAWGRDTEEHERVAWHEGVADALAGLWLWDRRQAGEKPMPLGGFRRGTHVWHTDDDQEIEVTDPTDDGRCDLDGEFICELGSEVGTHRIPACHAGALWDILDDPPDDDDDFSGASAITQAEVFKAFDDFRDQDCDLIFGNHCSFEFGDEGLNHHDWAFNFIHPTPEPRDPIDQRAEGIEQVFEMNGLSRGHP